MFWKIFGGKVAKEGAITNRVIDLGISLGSTYNSISHNDIAPTPSFTSTSFGLSIPLKFSNKYKGESQITTEVSQDCLNYQAVRKQDRQFRTGMLDEAKKVPDGKIYSYRRGRLRCRKC